MSKKPPTFEEQVKGQTCISCSQQLHANWRGWVYCRNGACHRAGLVTVITEQTPEFEVTNE